MAQSPRVMLALAVISLTVVPLVHAGSVVIDFEALSMQLNGCLSPITTYSEDGFTITTNLDGLGGSICVVGYDNRAYTGSTAIWNGFPGKAYQLTQTNGNPFTLTSIDLAELNDYDDVSVTFVGYLSGGGTVTETFDLDGITWGDVGADPVETFTFSNGFTNLMSVTWNQGEFPLGHTADNIVVCPFENATVEINVGSINCNNDSMIITVVLLSTNDLDTASVDHTTVTFEGAYETHVDQRSGEPRRHEEDVNSDGLTDLVFHFRLGETGLTCESTEGTLMGEELDGTPIVGTDSLRMVPGTTVITVGEPLP